MAQAREVRASPSGVLSSAMAYVLHILTHGRRYCEEYDALEEAITAALALESEPRERAEFISRDGKVCVDREQLAELAATTRAQ